ncbi:MAG TPA: serine hydrolase domain-containing protein [Acidobacteriota bacterium]|nr:serine hydrolase domain-containing protein [Acidobacteriota bacterium]
MQRKTQTIWTSFLALLLLLLQGAAPLAAAGEPVEEPVEEPQADIDMLAHKVMKSQHLVGLAVGTVIDGQVDYLRGYGWQDREAEIPVDSRKTLFRWASISKTLTGILAVKLATQGKLDLDRPITDYLKYYRVPPTYLQPCGEDSNGGDRGQEAASPCRDGFRDVPLESAQQVITMRQLLGHLGGIMHYSNGRGSPTPPNLKANDPQVNKGFAWALAYFDDKPLIAPPGTRFSYTTFGFNLAGAVLEAASGRSYADLLREHITQPLDLDTLQPDYEWADLPNRAAGYRRFAGEVLRQGSSDVSWKLPGGGVISTIKDLTDYCQGLLDDDLLTAAEKELLWTAQETSDGSSTSYGLGFRVAEQDGRRQVEHGGSQQKAKTYLLAIPAEGTCVTVMSNSVHADPRDIAGKLLTVLDQREPE